jgi:glycoprotein 6-alpha-L-fucosyltransferase
LDLDEATNVSNKSEDEPQPVVLDHQPSLKERKNIFHYKSKIEDSILNLWWLNEPRLLKMKEDKSFSDVVALLNDVGKQQESILVDLQSLAELIMDWQLPAQSSKEMAEKLQKQLHKLQNPSNCDKARKLVCSTKVECGFGCQAHHLVYCFMLAYWTGRTFVMESKSWSYGQGKGWEGAFLPMSDTCTTARGAVQWSGDHKNHQVCTIVVCT